MPVLVMHGDDDRIVPYANSAPLSAKLLKNGILKPIKAFHTACPRPRPIPSTPTCWLLSEPRTRHAVFPARRARSPVRTSPSHLSRRPLRRCSSEIR